jgi:hypothetical protein
MFARSSFHGLDDFCRRAVTIYASVPTHFPGQTLLDLLR